MTLERKTASNFLSLLERVYHNVEKEWNVVISAVVTDASGETRKARREFVAKYPSVVVLDCYAHQVHTFFYFRESANNIIYVDQSYRW